eukprot:TRINITY_DN8908_c1_g2_i1.p1 TRINITY_DN8908_c1_g2~~TRINITY_DN8908_c1_g2_i1.p1  ORF type:complete len:446 (-),score=64.49 TRINITY_DN8908_c1_g2_i1:894-2120(-)
MYCSICFMESPTPDELLQPEDLQFNTDIVVGNIHVLFNPQRGDIKLGQLRVFLNRVEKSMRKVVNLRSECPCIVMGDFNATPSGKLYQFLRKGQLDLRGLDRRGLSGQVEGRGQAGWGGEGESSDTEDEQLGWGFNSTGNSYRWSRQELKAATGVDTGNIVKHPLKLVSAYKEVTSREPTYTTSHNRAQCTVDYIWYSTTGEEWKLHPQRVLQPPSETLVKDGLPLTEYPSDHICLLADFELRVNLTNVRNKQGQNQQQCSSLSTLTARPPFIQQSSLQQLPVAQSVQVVSNQSHSYVQQHVQHAQPVQYAQNVYQQQISTTDLLSALNVGNNLVLQSNQQLNIQRIGQQSFVPQQQQEYVLQQQQQQQQIVTQQQQQQWQPQEVLIIDSTDDQEEQHIEIDMEDDFQ